MPPKKRFNIGRSLLAIDERNDNLQALLSRVLQAVIMLIELLSTLLGAGGFPAMKNFVDRFTTDSSGGGDDKGGGKGGGMLKRPRT